MKKRFSLKNPASVSAEEQVSAVIEQSEGSTDKQNDEHSAIESGGRRRFLQNSVLIAGGAALTNVAGLAYAEPAEVLLEQGKDAAALTTEQASKVFSRRHKNPWYYGPSPEKFKDLLQSRLDNSLWPPEALRPDYVAAAILLRFRRSCRWHDLRGCAYKPITLAINVIPLPYFMR